VADDALSEHQGDAPDRFGETCQFREVFQKEVGIIARRRAHRLAKNRERTVSADERAAHAKELKLHEESKDVAGQRILAPPETANLVGLALSGGGIRSAAFCLGALQALDVENVLERVDYLSTVSGGGYIGCSLTAALESRDQFPFRSELREDEPPALQQIRNYSNYLFPHGARGLLYNASIYARGLLVNAVLVVGAMLAAAAITLLYYSLRDADPQWWPLKLAALVFNPFGLQHFFLSLTLALLIALAGVIWGVVQSHRADVTEIPGLLTKPFGIAVIALGVVLFCELQPYIIDQLFAAGSNDFFVLLTSWIKSASALLAPIGAAMAFLASKLGEYVKSATESPKLTAQIKGLIVQAAIYAGGLILPALIWIGYLDIVYWGVCINTETCACLPPIWLAIVSYKIFGLHGYAPTLLYAVAAAACFLLSLLMRPNANSLHPLYRDRLRKAFLFVPQSKMGPSDLPVFDKPLSEISCRNGPYHLINAALNIQESKTANRRGRNADFFLFSPQFVGSKSTGYVATDDVEQVAIGFDLATAMAVSGAAVSSSMGAQSIKPLTATLALLNIRLGYWLRNPLRLARAKPPDQRHRGVWSEFRRRNNLFANYYFVLELFGLLTERRKSVYLTDGGHIENLGIYELLRRRCAVIIAVDAECDPQMAFGSFNTLERYALIDMGVRIDLPWQQIADESLATSKAIDDKSDTPKHHGPHCAIGEITYPNDRKGILVYIKASLTGDENDYVFDYKKRYSDFPHETTLDQWFTEEQFEAYRALGFHAAHGLFSGADIYGYLRLDEDRVALPNVAVLNGLFAGAAVRPPAAVDTAFELWEVLG
jgi:Patatin-like phospholipase